MLSKIIALIVGLSFFYSGFSYSLKVASLESRSSIEVRSLYVVKKALKEISGGNLDMIIYPESQLGNKEQIASMLREGEVDFAPAGVGYFFSLVPDATIINVPYAFTNFDQVRKALNSKGGEYLVNKVEKYGITILKSVMEVGFRQTTSNKPIYKLSDFKGLKIRVPPTPLPFGLQIVNGGGSLVTVPYSELYLALQTHLVDGQENPLQLIKDNKLYEVQKYLAITNHMVDAKRMTFSKKRWDKLSNREKDWIQTAIYKGVEFYNKEARAARARTLEYLKSEGMIITRPDLEEFRNSMKPYFKKAEKMYSKIVVDTFLHHKWDQ